MQVGSGEARSDWDSCFSAKRYELVFAGVFLWWVMARGCVIDFCVRNP